MLNMLNNDYQRHLPLGEVESEAVLCPHERVLALRWERAQCADWNRLLLALLRHLVAERIGDPRYNDFET